MVLNHKNRNKALFDYFHGKVLPKNLKFKNKLDNNRLKMYNTPRIKIIKTRN
jgi:hypothetical protein